MKEFVINNASKYVRSKVNIDRSSESISLLSTEKKPFFKEEEIFLKVLIEGKANLYSYEDSNLRRYFYSNEQSNIEQLVFKSYLTSDGKKGENNHFRQQLLNSLKCASINSNRVKNLEYKKNSLTGLFVEYNECSDSEFVNYEEKQKRDLFNLNLRPRFNSSTLSVETLSNSRNTDFGNKTGFGFGVEIEYILPFNKSKWSVILEPTYQSFKSEKTSEAANISGGQLTAKVDYTSIEFPLGIRHYLYLNQDSSFFINASIVFDYSSDSVIEYTRADGTNLSDPLKIESNSNLALGVGYKFQDKYSLEMRYLTNRDVLNYQYSSSDYKTISVIFGYSLF